MKTAILLVILLPLLGCTPSPNKPYAFDAAAIDTEALGLMKREDVQGMALAVIEEGKVAHVAAYGRRNVERNLPLTTTTISKIRLASGPASCGALSAASRAELIRPQVVTNGRHTIQTLKEPAGLPSTPP